MRHLGIYGQKNSKQIIAYKFLDFNIRNLHEIKYVYGILKADIIFNQKNEKQRNQEQSYPKFWPN